MIIQLDRTIAIYRLSLVSGDKTRYITLTTTLDSTIQPLADEKAAQYGGSSGKLFMIFCDVDKDIKQGDQIRDKDGNIYKVLSGGVENRNDGFIADYLGIAVQRIDDD